MPDDPMQPFWDSQKELHGKVATYAWIGWGLVNFYMEPDATLISWQALLYFTVGMFLAALVLGAGAYLVQRRVASAEMSSPDIFEPSGIARLKRKGWGLLFAQVIIVAIASSQTIRLLFSV